MDGPDGIQNGELRHRETVVELEDGEDRVVETRVKKEPEGDEERDVTRHGKKERNSK